jgi:hypothetical protein
MVITIWVEDRDPVSGRAGVGHQQPRPFAGWLQLLGLLSDLVERQEASEAPPAGLGGQPDPRAQPELGQDVGDMGMDGAP